MTWCTVKKEIALKQRIAEKEQKLGENKAKRWFLIPNAFGNALDWVARRHNTQPSHASLHSQCIRFAGSLVFVYQISWVKFIESGRVSELASEYECVSVYQFSYHLMN